MREVIKDEINEDLPQNASPTKTILTSSGLVAVEPLSLVAHFMTGVTIKLMGRQFT